MRMKGFDLMDKEVLLKLNMDIDLMADISEVIRSWITEGEGSFTITNDNVLSFQHDIAEMISKYAITKKGFFEGVDTLDKEYHKFFDMYHKNHGEFRDYKILAEKRVSELNKEKQFFIELLMEKSEELAKVKRKLLCYED